MPSEEGQGSPDEIPLQVVHDVFQQRDDRARPLTASDIMEEIGCARRTAHNKLNALVDRGILETRKVGSRSRVWWTPIREPPEEEPAADISTEFYIRNVDLPGTGETLEARREALAAAYRFLKEHPEAKKSDFQTEVFPDHPAGFETAEGWWNAIQPALAELPGVDPPEEREHIWYFLGG